MSEYERGLQDAINVVQSEARHQWEMDSRWSVGAHIVAQRMEVVAKVLQGLKERHQGAASAVCNGDQSRVTDSGEAARGDE